MSSANTAVNPVIKIVIPPTPPIQTSAPAENSGKALISSTIPAATMVAECSSAETGVGPFIAAASQLWKGTWADLPAAANSSASAPTCERLACGTSAILLEPLPRIITKTPIYNPKSAKRLIKKTLLAARPVSAFQCLVLISRYEQKPSTSQAMTKRIQSPANSSSCIAPKKSEMLLQKRHFPFCSPI